MKDLPRPEKVRENLREGWEPWPARPVRSFSGAPQRQRSGGQPGPAGARPTKDTSYFPDNALSGFISIPIPHGLMNGYFFMYKF
ncbi:MAG: hypothetical protein NZ529_11045 [Cytophagaceae bacterium]|nr:hypothetical protein [Cytophagaceae bacterium]MDW8457320.1 hypothetical protein [Cytophagaceae bacterium]